MTFDEIVADIMDALNLTSSDATTRVGKTVNKYYRRITSSIGLVTSRRVVVTANTTIGSRYVTFTSAEKLLSVFDATQTPVRVLDEISFDEMRQRGETASIASTPLLYAIASQDANSVTIILDGTPTTVFPLSADAETTVSTLSGTDVPAFPESYHDVLIYGPLTEEYRKLEKAALKAQAQADYERRLSEMRMFLAMSAYRSIYQGKSSALSAPRSTAWWGD